MEEVRCGMAIRVKDGMTLKEFKEQLHAMEIAIHRHLCFKSGRNGLDFKMGDILIRLHDNKVKLSCMSTEDAECSTYDGLQAFDIEE